MPTIKAHCNNCSGERNHDILHTEKTSWEDDNNGVCGTDWYQIIRCCGCDSVKFKHTNEFSEDSEQTIHYYPPTVFRCKPQWFHQLFLELEEGEEFVYTLLNEIYVALQNNLPSLAAMGIRSLLEKVMISKTGDHGSFANNLNKFETDGFVSRIQRQRLEKILEVGHATIHRLFTPKTDEVITLIEIAEHVIESIYLHEEKVKKVTKRVPARSKKTP